MSFENILIDLKNLLKASPRLNYVPEDWFLIGYTDSYPQQGHTIILEPDTETEDDSNSSAGLINVTYRINIYFRLIMPGANLYESILGTDEYTGILKFVDNGKNSIIDDETLGYNRKGFIKGRPVELTESGFIQLNDNQSYITICVNDDKKPRDIFCGDGAMTPVEIASLVQSNIRSLSSYSGNRFENVTVLFDESERRFIIESTEIGANNSIEVTPHANYDCSMLLGFDTGFISERGRKILKIKFDPVTVVNTAFPVRYRILPVLVTEEKLRHIF